MNIRGIEERADPRNDTVLLGQVQGLVGRDPDIASRLFVTSSRERLDVPTLRLLLLHVGVREGSLEHAGSGDEAVTAAAHQEIAARGRLEDPRDDALGKRRSEMGIVEDTEAGWVDVGIRGNGNHARSELSLA